MQILNDEQIEIELQNQAIKLTKKLSKILSKENPRADIAASATASLLLTIMSRMDKNYCKKLIEMIIPEFKRLQKEDK